MKLQTQYLIKLAEKGVRGDGRKSDEYRKIEIEKNIIAKAEGSAKVKKYPLNVKDYVNILATAITPQKALDFVELLL